MSRSSPARGRTASQARVGNHSEAVVRVDRLAAGGEGVARLEDGRALFIPLTAPGDQVRVRIIEERKRFARAEMIELLESGPGRVSPRCSLFGRCGGCSWQHLDYPLQVEAKHSILHDALVRIGGFELSPEFPFTASPDAYRYRHRARVLSESGQVGFRASRSHQLCATSGHCPILTAPLEAALRDLEGDRLAAGETAAREEWELSQGIDEVRAVSLADAGRCAPIEMQLGEERLRISVGVFVQANALLIQRLIAALLRCAEVVPETSVLELHAGAGSFTLGLARRARRLVAVESNPAAAADLAENLRRAGLEHAEVRCQPAEQALSALSELRPDVVVLDPPRTGLGEQQAKQLAGLGASRLVYVSCDPATLARDLSTLRSNGYALAHVEGFDLFPQTAHVEALAVMTRA